MLDTFCPETDVLPGLVVVDGTHSSGKTTLLNDYFKGAAMLDETFDCYFPYKERGAGIPVFGVAEAATAYDAWVRPARTESCLTSGYNLLDQAAIELTAFSSIEAAMIACGRRAKDLGAPAGIVLADRSPASGHVYARLRLGRTANNVDLREVCAASEGKLMTNPSAEYRVDIQQLGRTQLQGYCKLVLIPDHHEIDFEDNGLRQTDLDFRDAIATEMIAYYSGLLGATNVQHITGNRRERLAKLRLAVQGVALAAH